MKLSWKVYGILAGILTASLLLAFSAPAESYARQLLALPGMTSLIGALYQLLRDGAQHQKAILVQQVKQEYDLAITSHMANLAFEHVAFCEEYLAEFQNSMVTLFRNAECEEMLTHAANLLSIRVRFRTWLTCDIEDSLEPFEKALRQIGSAAHFYKVDPGRAVSTGKIDQANNLMSDIFGYTKEDTDDPANEEVRDKEVIRRVRHILGIEQLTHLRLKQFGNISIRPMIATNATQQ